MNLFLTGRELILKYCYKLVGYLDKSFIVPKKIRLESSSYCQLRCPSCPTTTKEIDPVVGKGFFKISDFKNLVDNNRFIKSIELSNYGEILLNPEIVEIMEYAYNKGIKLTADNGVNLNNISEEAIKGLVKFKLRSMTCSIDGASQESYVQYRIRGNFDNVIKNIEKINHYKAKYNSDFPKLKWQFILFNHNEHEVEKARNMARKLNMEFKIKLSWDPDLAVFEDKNQIRKKIKMDVVSREEYFDKYKKDYKEDNCKQLWTHPQVNWDGKLLGCCKNFWGDFGENVFEKGLLKALNNHKIRYARKMLRGKAEPMKDIPCTTCKVYINRKKYENWI